MNGGRELRPGTLGRIQHAKLRRRLWSCQCRRRTVSFQPNRATICSESLLTESWLHITARYPVCCLGSMVIQLGEKLCITGRLAWRSFWISASISLNQSLCFLVEGPPTFSANSWRMFSAATTDTRDLLPGLAIPPFLIWPGAPL